MTWVTWVLIGIFLVVLMMVFKAKEVRHKLGFVVVASIVLFLVFSFYQVYTTQKLDFTSLDGVVNAGKLYASWLGTMFGNVAKVSNYAIQQDWTIDGSNVSSSNVTTNAVATAK